MYESLTRLLAKLEGAEGETGWVDSEDADRRGLRAWNIGYVHYLPEVRELEDEIYAFYKAHPEYDKGYHEVLEKAGIEWGMDSMRQADATKLDGPTCMALLLGAVRAEHFCDGALEGFLRSGSIQSWLRRLEEIDRAEA